MYHDREDKEPLDTVISHAVQLITRVGLFKQFSDWK